MKTGFNWVRPSWIHKVQLTIAQGISSFPKQSRDLFRTLLFGIGAGLVAVGFQLTIRRIYAWLWLPLLHVPFSTFLWVSFLGIMGTSLLAGFLLAKICPEAAGSGIPQLKLSFWKDFGYIPWRVVFVKFFAGALTVGGGSSLGREGPTVQIAGGVASNLAEMTGIAKQARRPSMAAGAAAGLAAAFNTPISAITFVLEEIIEDLNSTRYLSQTLLAAVLATFVTHLLVGPDPAFAIPKTAAFSLHLYLITPFIAAAAALAGIHFQRLTLDWRAEIRRASKVPPWARPAVGAFVTWIVGSTVFYFFHRLGVFSLGYGDLQEMLELNIAWQVAAALFLAKFVATIASYSWGGCGGIFAPLLFLGASVGIALTGIIDLIHPLPLDDSRVLAVIGMSACLSSVIRAPITSVLIVFEMTHEFNFVPLLLLGMTVSQGLSRLLLKDNFYADILRRDGIQIERIIPPKTLSEWQRQEVSVVANFKPVVLTNLDKPSIEEVLKKHPHSFYPVLKDRMAVGVVSRADLVGAVQRGDSPQVQTAPSLFPDESIAEARNKILEHSAGMLLIVDRLEGRLLGVLTLHDLLRSEINAIEKED